MHLRPFRFLLNSQPVEFKPGETLLEAALRAGIEIPHSCGRNATCGTCRIRVLEGLPKLQPRNQWEAELALDRNFSEDLRLTCQTLAESNIEIETPKK